MTRRQQLTDDDLDEEEDDGEAEHADQAALLAGVAAPAPALASPHLVAAEQLLPMARVAVPCRLDLHFTLEWPDCCVVMSSLWVSGCGPLRFSCCLYMHFTCPVF